MQDAMQYYLQSPTYIGVPIEDYELIDQYFISTSSELTARMTEWAGPLEGKSTEEIGKYFDTIHDDYIALRDHISNY